MHFRANFKKKKKKKWIAVSLSKNVQIKNICDVVDLPKNTRNLSHLKFGKREKTEI